MQTSLLQTEIWARFKKKYGWEHHQLLGLSVLSRSLKFGYTFSYIPEITASEDEVAIVAAQAQSALSHVKNHKTIFGRAEFLIPFSEKNHTKLLRAGFVKAKDEVQPEHRQVIDLGGSIADIRTQMKQKGRYNIAMAEKKQVTVAYDQSTLACNDFIHLSQDTASRKGFVGRDPGYLKELIELLASEGMGGLWVARFEGKILAGAVISFVGGRASYMYGASSPENRNVMAPFLLHMKIIEEAKRRGCIVYDMIGVAPVDADRNHPWAGISHFKREFGGETIRYLGSYDRVYNPILYKVYSSFRKSK